MLETASDRAFLVRQMGDRMRVGGAWIRGGYDEPQAEAALVEGTAPEFRAARVDLDAAGVRPGSAVAGGTRVEEIRTHWGAIRGPFRVVRWASEDDGAIVVLGLQEISA